MRRWAAEAMWGTCCLSMTGAVLGWWGFGVAGANCALCAATFGLIVVKRLAKIAPAGEED